MSTIITVKSSVGSPLFENDCQLLPANRILITMKAGKQFELPRMVKDAVSNYWITRERQEKKQGSPGNKDQGARSAVTGGAHMNGFLDIFRAAAIEAGIEQNCIYNNSKVELPGYFRAEKRWDTVVVKDGELLAVIEAKSQVGPSFGNNFNNRTEEAIGSATDIWTAFREGKFASAQPWLGYLFLLEACKESNIPVRVAEPHFTVFDEFRGASYSKRYELFCRKLVRERLYTRSAFLTASAIEGKQGIYSEPAGDLTIGSFVISLISHLKPYSLGSKKK